MRSLLFSVLVCFSICAFAHPAQVVIVRHGEKITDNDPNLSPRGQSRAKALVGFFATNAEVSKFGAPVAIYATEPKSDGSQRSIQTITPLADKLGLQVNHDYTKKHVDKLVDAILNTSAYDGYTVVVAWVHDSIPEIAEALGAAGAPSDWPGKTFDRAWIIRFGADDKVSFMDLPQNLLPGDSSK